MSRFYASIQGNRGEATRQGSAQSGIQGHIRGWSSGAEVVVRPDPNDPRYDHVYVYRTGGSNRRDSMALVAHWREDKNVEYPE